MNPTDPRYISWTERAKGLTVEQRARAADNTPLPLYTRLAATCPNRAHPCDDANTCGAAQCDRL